MNDPHIQYFRVETMEDIGSTLRKRKKVQNEYKKNV